MISYKDLIELLRRNEEIDKKFHEIETRILSILNFRDLFEILLTEIQQQFRVPYAWITLIENCEVSDLVKYKESSNTLRTRIKIVERDRFTALVGHRRQPLLVNENIDPTYPGLTEELGISRPTSRKRVQKLANLGYLREVTKGNKKVFELTDKGMNLFSE